MVAARQMVASSSQESQSLRMLPLESTMSPLGTAAGNYWGRDRSRGGAWGGQSWTNLTPSSVLVTDQLIALVSKRFYTKT